MFNKTIPGLFLVFCLCTLGINPKPVSAQFNCQFISDSNYHLLKLALLKGKGALSQKWCNYHTGNYTECSDQALKNKHPGVDYADAAGTPVYAPIDGRVIRVTKGSDCQRIDCLSTLAIYNSSKTKTFIFLHMNSINVGVGATVRFGDLVGTIGKRGPASGN
ncbi:MAG: hypothetical protein FD167_2116, partial [bacterium]